MKYSLRLRIASAVVAIPLALGMTYVGGWVFAVAIATIVFLAQLEFFRLVRATRAAPALRMTMVTSLALVLIQHVRPDWTSAALTMAGTAICFYLLFKPKVATINDIATSILGLFYCAYLPSFWILVRSLNRGLMLTMLAFICIWAADIGAYFIGKTWGKTPLSAISPKKTVEGSVGGIGGSVAIAIGGAFALHWPLPILTGFAIGIAIGGASLLGDLTESLMKRNAGVKDSGDLIPGHGGILDRGDSYVFTAPLVYYFVQLLEL